GIPFAADIHDETNAIIGNVGQGGQAFVRGIQQQGTIKITWLEASMPKTCIAQYQQPNVTSEKIQQTIILNNILCQLQ
ncbi:FimD/PapC C-terminal domain-containing protein, partial [Escherichia coli]